MLGTLLPIVIDNRYRGYGLGLWLLGVVLFVKMEQLAAM